MFLQLEFLYLDLQPSISCRDVLCKFISAEANHLSVSSSSTPEDMKRYNRYKSIYKTVTQVKYVKIVYVETCILYIRISI